MKFVKFLLAILASLLSTGNAFALGAVSRACQFSTLPEAVKLPAVLFFQALGAPTSILKLPFSSADEQKKYWINEAITTDYIKVRYYLFAVADVYGLVNSPLSNFYRQWQYTHGYASPRWTAEEISAPMTMDGKFRIYYANRGPLYSARAGDPQIVVAEAMYWYERFAVRGSHNYYDPASKISGTLKETAAADCNLGEWGADKGMFDR